MTTWDVQLRVVEPVTSDAHPVLREVPAPSTIRMAAPVETLTPYVPVSSQHAIEALRGRTPIFKLDWNEATISPSPRVEKAIGQFVSNGAALNWYPELGSKNLCLALSDYTGLRPEHLVVTNGSDDALNLVCQSYLDPGDEVIIPVPTYNHFIVFAQGRGAEVKTVYSKDTFKPSMAETRASIGPKTRMVYLVSPNNPTGVLAMPEEVEALCQDFPDTLIIVDEAYFEFAQVTSIDLVKKYTNLIVTRTFSKAFGLAGLRVGYLAAHPSLVVGLSRLYNPKSVNTLAQIGAMAALEDLGYLNNYLDQVATSKELLRAFFASRPAVQAWVTPANFVVVRTPNVREALERLESLGVYVRDRSNYPGLEGCLRMSVGTVEQTQLLIDRLAKVF